MGENNLPLWVGKRGVGAKSFDKWGETPEKGVEPEEERGDTDNSCCIHGLGKACSVGKQYPPRGVEKGTYKEYGGETDKQTKKGN